MSRISWIDRLFYLFGPLGIAAALHNDSPISAVVMAFCFGNLFQIDLRKWIESADQKAAK